MSRECPEPKVFRCRNCDEEGHQSRDCPKPKDWSRVKCTNCSQFGHGAKRCPHPPAEPEVNGWGDGGGNLGAAAGGWSAGGVDSTKVSTGDWADESAAAAAASGGW